MLFGGAKRDEKPDEMNAGEVEDCVFKLDTFTNIMIASNDMLTVLQDMARRCHLAPGRWSSERECDREGRGIHSGLFRV